MIPMKDTDSATVRGLYFCIHKPLLVLTSLKKSGILYKYNWTNISQKDIAKGKNMKILEGFCLREVLGEKIAVPTGPVAAKLSGIAAMNETGEFIFNLLQTEQTEETLLAALLAEYDVSEEEARKDLKELLEIFRHHGLLVE